MKRHFVCFLLLSSVALAGTLTQYNTTWNGFSRTYTVYVPVNQSTPPALVVVLHPTTNTTTPPLFKAYAWEKLADQYGFVVVWPFSIFDTWVGSWHWECDGCESGFPAGVPDDSGFLRNIIVNLQGGYLIASGQTFVVGMSSGGFMTERVGMESSDLIAAIAPVSAAQYIQPVRGKTFVPPMVPYPPSVYELHGDIDTSVPYCGGTKGYWGVNAFSPGMDSDVGYWSGTNAGQCTTFSQSQPLCTAGVPTDGVNGQDATGCMGGTEVLFEREIGVAHIWVNGTEAKVWAFFASHQR